MANANQMVDAYIVVLGDDRDQIRSFIRTCTGRDPDTPSEWKYPTNDGSSESAFDEAALMYDASRCVHLIEASAFTETGEVREVPSQLLMPGAAGFEGKDLVGAILMCDYDSNILGGQRYENPSLDFKWDSLALIFPDRVPRLPNAGSDVAYLVRMGAMPFGHLHPEDENAKDYALSIVTYHLQSAYGDVHVDDHALLRILEAQVLGRIVSLAALLEDGEFDVVRQDIVREVGTLDMIRQEEVHTQWEIIRRTRAGHRAAMQEVASLYQRLNQESGAARNHLERQSASLKEKYQRILEKQKEEDLSAAKSELERQLASLDEKHQWVLEKQKEEDLSAARIDLERQLANLEKKYQGALEKQKEEDLITTRKRLEELEKRLGKELDDLKDIHERVKEEYQRVKEDNKVKGQEVERLGRELAILKNSHIQERKAYEDVSTTRHTDSLRRFEEERGQYEKNRASLQNEYDLSQKEYEKKIAALQNEYDRGRKEYERISGEKLDLERKIALLQDKYNEELRRREAVTGQKRKLEEEIATLQERYGQGLKELKEVNGQKLKLEERVTALQKSHGQELKGRQEVTRQKLRLEEEIVTLQKRYDQDFKDREWITEQKFSKERELSELQKRYDQELGSRDAATGQKSDLEKEMANLQKRFGEVLQNRASVSEQKSVLERELASLQSRYGQDLKKWEEIAARQRAAHTFSQPEATASKSFQQPTKRRTEIEDAYQEYERTHDWGEVKAQHPDVYEMQSFATLEELKESLPESVVKKRMGQIYLKYRQRDELAETTTFYDTGNLLGPLISTAKLSQLGYGLEDIDASRVYKFKGLMGAMAFTLGSITLEGRADLWADEGMFSKTYHVWDDPINLADVLLGVDDPDHRLENGVPPLLFTSLVDEYAASKKETTVSPPAAQIQDNTEINDGEPEATEADHSSTPNTATENAAPQSQPEPGKRRSRFSCCTVM